MLAFCLPHKRKLSHFDRYERSHRPLRTLTSVDTNAHIGRCETTSIKEDGVSMLITYTMEFNTNIIRR